MKRLTMNRNKKQQELRRLSAAQRQAEHSLLTPKERLAKLDARLGKGVGAARERARLQKMIADDFKPATAETAKEVFGVGKKKAGKKATKS